jgi:hypothetical protein
MNNFLELKMYTVDVESGDLYYVFAYSPEHAIVEVVNLKENNKLYPTDIPLSAVKEIDEISASEIVFDYNYITEELVKNSLLEYFSEVEEQPEDIYGVVSDNFISYE